MFQTSVLASGSKGNCILIRSKETAIILDAGISLKRILSSVQELGIDEKSIKGVIVSHEHGDHTRSAGAISRKLRIPLYISPDTFSYSANRIGDIKDRVVYFEAGSTFEIGDILVQAFSSSHDAIDSCNFCFLHDDRKLGVAIDLGFPTKLTTLRLTGSNALILESNHDEHMLMEGPYEWSLKMRVKGNHGHLSNSQAISLLSELMHPSLDTLILAHLSETNNCPKLAYKEMKKFLDSIDSKTKLLVAEQDAHTKLVDI